MEIEQIKELPIHFIGRGEARGYKFTQISVTNKAFIYEVSFLGNLHYEVFKHKQRVNPYTGIEYIRYPNSNAFGKWAWTCMTLERAKAKLIEIETKRK